MSDEQFDVIVVGNGIIGLSIAFELARRGTSRVQVIGPSDRQGAGSMAAGAMLNCFGEVTKYTLAHDASRAKLDICRAALETWPRWSEDVLSHCDHVESNIQPKIRQGTHVILNTRCGSLDSENFAAMIEALEKYQEPYEEVDPRSVVGLDPRPDSRPLRAVHLPVEGSIDARAFISALESALSQLGVDVRNGKVKGLLGTDDCLRGVELDSGEIVQAPNVVIAAGAYTETLLSSFSPGQIPLMMCGAGISLESRRVKSPAFETVIRTPNRSGSCGLHLVPLGDGLEYVGATNIVFRRPALEANMGMSQFLLECAREQLDQKLFYSRIRRWFVGNRPVTVDGYPLIGTTSLAGLYIASGTYRDGFHCSPTIASHIADQIRGEESVSAELFEAFRPERPPISTMSVEESINEFVYHGICSAFEGGLHLPPWSDSSLLEDHYLKAANDFYEQLDHPIGLSPEMLKFIAFNYRDEADVRQLRDYLSAAHGIYSSGS